MTGMKMAATAAFFGCVVGMATPAHAAEPLDLTPKLNAAFGYANAQIARWIASKTPAPAAVPPLQRVSLEQPVSVPRQDALAMHSAAPMASWFLAASLPLRIVGCAAGLCF